MTKLTKEFFERESKKVAKELIGRKLVRIIDGKRVSGVIARTMSFYKNGNITPNYHGMLQEPGKIHVFNFRGSYLLNISTEKGNKPTVVHINEIYPIDGVKILLGGADPTERNIENIANGPGKLTKSFKIAPFYSATSICGIDLWIEGEQAQSSKIIEEKGKNLAGICTGCYRLK